MECKKLLLIVPAFPQQSSDNFMVPFIQQFVIAFKEYQKDIEITIYTLHMPSGAPYMWNNIKVIPLNLRKKNPFTKPYFLLKSVFKIYKEVKKNNVQGVLSFWYRETALIGKLVSMFSLVKHFTWLQGQDVKKTNKYLRYFPPKKETLIALSTYQNDILYKELGFKAATINPIAVYPKFFPKLNHNERTVDILGAGSFIPLKNYHLFLDVIKEIKKMYPTVRVVLIGNGPLESELKGYVEVNGLQHNMTFPGLCSHEKTLDYMNDAKIFLHTSTFEGGGMVLYESLYSGCQVVSTIPIEDTTLDTFHLCTSKKEIIDTIKKLINVSKPAERISCTDIKKTTTVIRDLFFGP